MGLITTLTTDNVTLSHNEIYLLIKYFFDLEDQKYGLFKDCSDKSKNIEEGKESETCIQLKDELLKIVNKKLLKEYKGTFDLKLARKKEELDFFALGHPLIDTILSFCRLPEFSGSFTELNLKTSTLPDHLKKYLAKDSNLYLFVFSITFQGYIVENRLFAIVLDDKGLFIPEIADFMLNLENYNMIYDFKSANASVTNNNSEILEDLVQNAKKLVKRQSISWKQEIKELNDNFFNREREKKEKIYSHKQKALNMKLELVKQKLERKISQRPTEKQIQNISKLDDESEKQKRIKRFKLLEEDIMFLEKGIKKLDKKLDDLSFDYEDLKNDMAKRNLPKYHFNLLSFAVVKCIY